MEIGFFLGENFSVLLIIGGLITVMLAYRDTQMPASKNFVLIIMVLLVMSFSTSLEKWAWPTQDRESLRTLASVIHYVLQPFVIYLELVIIVPRERFSTFGRKFLLALPVIINTIIYLIAPFTGTLVFSYDENYYFNRGILGSSIYIVTFVYLALLLYWSVRYLQQHNRRKSIILFFIAAVAIVAAVLEGTNLVTGFIDESFALGVFLYYTYLVTIRTSRMQSALATKELELTQSKVKLLREQIRPHFVFNSLQIIKSLIRTDQDKAVLCLEDFSHYLHANIDILKSDKLVSFEGELENIEAYVSLALADESKGIEMEYDIQEKDFNLPALSIEPLVENALRHGVAGGGKVKLSSRAEGGDVIITVADNGIGFGNSGAAVTEKDKDRTGIGLENVRKRLATLCNGTVDVQSDTDGTIVTVRIPDAISIALGSTASAIEE